MEFDVGTILYILVTLVAVIIGLLGKKKKPAPGSGSEDAQPGFLENLERAMRMGDEEDPVAERTYGDESVADAEEDHEIFADTDREMGESIEPGEEFEPARANPMMQEYERIIENRSRESAGMVGSESRDEEPLEVIDLDEEESADYFEIVKDFDAETAVIYSAIINRLDY